MFETVYEKDYSKIDIDKESRLVMISWFGNCTSEEYRTAMLQAFQFSKDYCIDAWLSDATHGTSIHPEDFEWLSKEFVPTTCNHINKTAIVVNRDIFRKIQTECMESMLKTSIKHVGYFDDKHQAIKWLSA